MGEEPRSLRKEWELTQESFEILLARLDPNRECAAEKYELIRRKLITFFENHGCIPPEDCADITIDRVARKVSGGTDIYTSDPSRFFFGIAHNIVHEYWAAHTKRERRLATLRPVNHPQERLADFKDEQMECLQHCIKQLALNNRELIIQYYQGDTRTKIANRKKLSEHLGIPINALRIKALRIRKKIELCVTECLKQLEGA